MNDSRNAEPRTEAGHTLLRNISVHFISPHAPGYVQALEDVLAIEAEAAAQASAAPPDEGLREALKAVTGYVLAASWPKGTPMEDHRQEAIAALDRALAADKPGSERETEDGVEP